MLWSLCGYVRTGFVKQCFLVTFVDFLIPVVRSSWRQKVYNNLEGTAIDSFVFNSRTGFFFGTNHSIFMKLSNQMKPR